MGNRLSHMKELFDKLDRAGKGYLVLSDILGEEIPTVCHSPVMMFLVCCVMARANLHPV